MTHLYKRALALTLLISATHTTSPVNYKNTTFLASAGIATVVTATMLYNYFYPVSEQTMIDRAVAECQLVKTLHNDISFIHENELMIVDQDSQTKSHNETFNKIKGEITTQSDNYSLCNYVNNLDYEINQLQQKLQGLAHIQTNLFNRSPKVTDENESLLISFDNSLSEIQMLRTELQQLITQLFVIRTHVTGSSEYAYELRKYQVNDQEDKQDDVDDRYLPYNTNTEEKEDEKIKAPDATVAPAVTAEEQTTATESSSRAPFNSSDWWCDMTNPFNS